MVDGNVRKQYCEDSKLVDRKTRKADFYMDKHADTVAKVLIRPASCSHDTSGQF